MDLEPRMTAGPAIPLPSPAKEKQTAAQKLNVEPDLPTLTQVVELPSKASPEAGEAPDAAPETPGTPGDECKADPDAPAVIENNDAKKYRQSVTFKDSRENAKTYKMSYLTPARVPKPVSLPLLKRRAPFTVPSLAVNSF